MTKEEFLNTLDEAIQLKKGILIYMHHPNLFDAELIYNTARNVDEKRAYYDATYNDQMQQTRFPMTYIARVELVD